MKIAVIDLGTNTFNLSIGLWENNQLTFLHSEKEGVALGMGGINEQIISLDAMERAQKCLKRFSQKCMDYGALHVRAIGTSAIRDARNKVEFLNAIKKQTGFEVEVIDGHREAELIYKGINYSCEFSNSSMIMDIGGGSTEFIEVNNGIMSSAVSLDIGVSRVYQMFSLNDPLSEDNIIQLESFFENKSNGFFENKKCHTLVGASGSFETFYELVHRQKFPKGFKTQTIDLNKFQIQLSEIIRSTQAERDKNDFIIPIRKKMAPIAAVKSQWVMKKLSVEVLIISPCSLKEGVFVELRDLAN